jgi:Rps23 Pro-64 3,4-dihydroxylase Tpa1-like proline 4-hydroxylase
MASASSELDRLLSSAVRGRLEALAAKHGAEYASAEPFPHAVIDDFLPEEIVTRVVAEFPSSRQVKWIHFDDMEEKKLAFPEAESMPSPVRDLLLFLNSRPVLHFLEELTGIRRLIPDPYFVGGGLHQIAPGGFLGVHADFNRHEGLGLDRRLNLLLYLNRDWKDEYGGHLQLWDPRQNVCVKRVLPVFNRCVVFSTTDDALHGHPEPLSCPPGWTRKSIATYYYTNGRPENELVAKHSTLFRPVPGVARPSRQAVAFKRAMRAVLPPIISDMYYRIRARLG